MLVVEPKLILPFCSIYTEPSMGLLNWIEKPLIWQPLFLAFSFLFLIPMDAVLFTGQMDTDYTGLLIGLYPPISPCYMGYMLTTCYVIDFFDFVILLSVFDLLFSIVAAQHTNQRL